MKSRQQQVKPNMKNQTSTGTAPTKRGRKKLKPGAPSTKVVPLPPIYRMKGDEVALRLKTSQSLSNSVTNGSSWILGLGPGTIAASGYFALGDIFPLLIGLQAQYTHFMITRIVAQLVPVTAATSGGYVALGYQPDDTYTSNPPVGLGDVASSLHADVAQVTEIAGIELNASHYYNEWRLCSTTTSEATALSQAGVIQMFGRNEVPVLNVAVMVFQLEVDIHFSGFRRT
jgi:hypothetical protein